MTGKSVTNPEGEGPLCEANPRTKAVPPMDVVVSFLLPLLSSKIDQVFRLKFRMITGLRYTMVLGASFMSEHRSIICFDNKLRFRLTPSTSYVPFAPKEVNEATVGGINVHRGPLDR